MQAHLSLDGGHVSAQLVQQAHHGPLLVAQHAQQQVLGAHAVGHACEAGGHDGGVEGTLSQECNGAEGKAGRHLAAAGTGWRAAAGSPS